MAGQSTAVCLHWTSGTLHLLVSACGALHNIIGACKGVVFFKAGQSATGCNSFLSHLQVIEARNLAVPSDLLHTFYTMDSYSVVSCTSEAGVTSHHTKIERNNLQPHWNERCNFDDVALTNSLTVAIFDHKKLSSDVFLGQV